MKDSAAVLMLIALVLIPPAAVLFVIREQMDRLRETFLAEIKKLREELMPLYQPEQQLIPQVEALSSNLSALTERITRMEAVLSLRATEGRE